MGTSFIVLPFRVSILRCCSGRIPTSRGREIPRKKYQQSPRKQSRARSSHFVNKIAFWSTHVGLHWPHYFPTFIWTRFCNLWLPSANVFWNLVVETIFFRSRPMVLFRCRMSYMFIQTSYFVLSVIFFLLQQIFHKNRDEARYLVSKMSGWTRTGSLERGNMSMTKNRNSFSGMHLEMISTVNVLFR